MVNATDPKTRTPFVTLAYQKHRRELDRYLARRLHNRQDARELAQEVWTRLLRVNDATEILEPLAYIYRAAANVISEFHMRQKRERVAFDSDAYEDAAANPAQPSPDELVEEISQQSQFERAMGELSPLYRNVVLMKLRDGLSYTDIGERLGLAPRTAEQYFYRALARVRSRREVPEGKRP